MQLAGQICGHRPHATHFALPFSSPPPPPPPGAARRHVSRARFAGPPRTRLRSSTLKKRNASTTLPTARIKPSRTPNTTPDRSTAQTATATNITYPSDAGSSTFHPRSISWSKRKQGIVQRTHTYSQRKNSVFAQNAPKVSTVLVIDHGGVLSQLLNGMSHPPKNRQTSSPGAVTMLEYSER